jgi:hypothetical protein
MKPLEFLAEVLPPPGHGHFCVAELSSRRKEHIFIDDLEEAKPAIKRWLGAERDIYFALATYDDPTKGRKAENTRYIKALFIDMDGYESKKAAASALAGFLERTGLDRFGAPHLIFSGGGLHCYWPLTQPVSTQEWKPVAEAFKRLCKQENLRIDMTVTADAARVLRIPNTVNFKKLPNGKWKYGEPKQVKFLLQGDAQVDLKTFGAYVLSKLDASLAPLASQFGNATMTLEGKRPTKKDEKQSAVLESMLQSSSTRFEQIWLKTERDAGCGQLAFYMDNAQQDGMEPMWRGLLSWAKVCEDGLEYAKRLSDMHPYPHERMQQKLNEIKGPYSCVKMDEENPGVCQKCPYWGKITNALALGRDFKTDNRAKFYDIPINTADDTAEDDEEVQDAETEEFTGAVDEAAVPANVRTRRSMRPPPPKGFAYADSPYGGVLARVKEKDASGTIIDTQVMVLPYDLFVVDILKMEGNDHHAHLMAIRHVGGEGEKKTVEYTPIILPTKAAVTKDELIKCLASHNIYAAHGGAMDAKLYSYVRNCVEEAALVKQAVDVPIQYGWQKDHSFVYNNRVFRPDGTEVAVPMPGLENLNRATNSKGSLEKWRKPWRLLQEKQLNTMLAVCLDTFGSPLMTFADYEGFTWHIGSTLSGTGKSLTLSLKAGVWGHPIRYRTGKGTSQVAMQQRAGLLNSLPLLIDEITSKARNDVEWAPGFIFDISEGQGKERMESGSNRERVNNSTWALTCTMTSNVHMTDVMTGSRKHSSHGELMRMLEWNPSKPLKFTQAERAILKELRLNYGVAGEAWVRWVVQNRAEAKSVWQRVHAKLRDELKFEDDERYWHAGCASIVASAIMLGDKYSGILPDMPIKAIVDALRGVLDRARDSQEQSARSAEDVLNAYTREYYGKFVVLRKDKENQILAEMGKDLLGSTSTRTAVFGRIEHGTTNTNWVEYYIEEQLLKQHCASMSFGYADFRRQLKALADRDDGRTYQVNFSVKKDLLARTDGPALRVVCMHLRIHKDVFDEAKIAVASDRPE